MLTPIPSEITLIGVIRHPSSYLANPDYHRVFTGFQDFDINLHFVSDLDDVSQKSLNSLNLY
jgi:hypothetical protein